MTDAQKRSKKKYKGKLTRLTVDFYPTEQELIEQINKQPQKQTYIKNLIRNDMRKEKVMKDLGIPEIKI